MLAQNKIKNLRKLQQRKFRALERQYLVEGIHGVEEALKSAPDRVQLVIKREDLDWGTQQTVPVEIATAPQFAKISMQKSPEGLIALLRMPPPPPWKSMENSTVFFLDQVQNPSNLGTIIRTSDWFGFRQIILSAKATEEYNPKCVQASMGSIHRISIHREGLNFSWEDISDDTLVVGTRMEGRSYLDLVPQKNKIILLGNESQGIQESYASKCSEWVSIPRVGQAESLNLGIAHGILAASYCDQNC